MKHGKKKSKRKYLISILFIVISALGLVSGAFYAKMKDPQNLFVSGNVDVNDQFNQNIINIMLVGFDKDEVRSKEGNIFRTDTNIVLTINLEKKTIDIISIPRDSYVSIANTKGMDKFNSAYGHGYLNRQLRIPKRMAFNVSWIQPVSY